MIRILWKRKGTGEGLRRGANQSMAAGRGETQNEVAK